MELEDRFKKIGKTRKATIPPMPQAKVRANCSSGGLCSVQNPWRLASKHLTLMANEIMDILPHKHFNALVSNFSLSSVHLSRNTVIGHALEASESILNVKAFAPHLPQCKERAGTAEIFGTSDEDDFEQSDLESEQWNQNVHIGSQDKFVREDIMSHLSEFASR